LFPLEFGTPDGWRLDFKLVNQTGATLHNALLVDNVKIDKQKLAAKQAADQGNVDLSHLLQSGLEPGPQFSNAQTNL
jgi:hypothetical protein